ncbi:MAG TPA: glycerol dehydratase reactivase beta/small subunit family protein [Verrucomicrobiae bacterium]|jgi:Dehydratase medium subunit|nr:glycerol dehydratase reactivase beta/small subunit family protein [Verrucomicrobiae bacterium]
MPEYASISESRRPTVAILVVRGGRVDLSPVFWGMEEEGIPYEVQECPAGEAVGVAKEASLMSPLNVGIGVDPLKGVIVLHHRDLPADQPLFVFQLHEIGPTGLRRLGINAARLVKAEPLVPAGEPAKEDTGSHSQSKSANPLDEEVDVIVQRILAELAKA